MASKQLGRLRQWAGEVISSREKTTVHEEFRDLEKDIELRRDGVHRLLVASEGYHHILSKKKASDSLTETDKLLPIDTLGLVMISHGDEFGPDSFFGRALVKLGRAHCKVATLQEAYALTLKDTFLASMDQFKEDIKEYEILRKKLDGKRLTYDAAASKYERVLNNKKEKEKDKIEAEDELDRAKQRYDEMTEDLRAHIHAIQENEHKQLDELTSFLALETNFVQSYLAVLHDVKESWHEGVNIKKNGLPPKSNGLSLHIPQLSRANSLRSNGRGATPSSLSSELSDSEQIPVSKHLRRGSSGSKPSSRPASRLSRMRTNSSASGEEEKSGNKKSRRMSVASWVDSVTGSKEKKSKDTEAFATLDDDAAVNNAIENQTNGTGGTPKKTALGRSSSNGKSKENMSPAKVAPRILKPPSMQGKKVVRALYDFSGSTDELSFKSGNEIIVLNEVLDDWWMGELDGQKGLFPMSYTRPQSGKQATSHKPGVSESKGVNRYRKEYPASDVDEDGELATAPMMIKTPIYGAFNDAMSITSSLVDDEDDFRTQPKFFPQEVRQPFSDTDHRFVVQQPAPLPPPPPSQRPKRSVLLSGDPAQESLINGTMDEDSSLHEMTATSTVKRQPPPPPPRRPANRLQTSGPPVPERKPPTKTSPSGSSLNVTSSSSPIGSGYDRSPFDSAVELGATVVCNQFRQHPFKREGMCSNCLEFHD